MTVLAAVILRQACAGEGSTPEYRAILGYALIGNRFFGGASLTQNEQTTSNGVTLRRGSTTVQIKFDPSKAKTVTAIFKGRVIWQAIPQDWKAWKIAAADVDGDGKEELLIGLNKVTRHSPNRIHTIYVYGFDGAQMYPKWRGSRMARDFVDFSIAKNKKGDKIFTLDRLLDGRYALSCYTWSGFGFRKNWERGAWKQARLQEGGHGTITIVTEDGPVKISTEGSHENI